MSGNDSKSIEREDYAVGAFLSSMKECGCDGKRVRYYMLKAMGMLEAEEKIRSQHARIQELEAVSLAALDALEECTPKMPFGRLEKNNVAAIVALHKTLEKA